MTTVIIISFYIYVFVSIRQYLAVTTRPKATPTKRRVRNPPPPPTRILVKLELDEISFKNSMEKPYKPSIEVSLKLWGIISGEDATDLVYTPSKRPLGMIAVLATLYLRYSPNSDYFKRV